MTICRACHNLCTLDSYSALYLTSGAVARIGLVKPDKAKGVENIVLQMAQRGQLNEKVSLA